MFYQPELMIYLWILPVLAMVILPAFWTFVGILYQALERNYLSDVRGFIDLAVWDSADSDQQDRREKSRILIDGPKARVARQVNCCQTYVKNISNRGICLSNIPRKMYQEADEKFKVVFRTREGDYTMFVQPKWKRQGDNGYMVGAEMVNIPPGWDYFVSGLCRNMVTGTA